MYQLICKNPHITRTEIAAQISKTPRTVQRTFDSIDSPILCGITDWCNEENRDVVLFYKATSFSGELESSDEGEVWWERYDNLRNLKLTSGFETYLKVYEGDDLT